MDAMSGEERRRRADAERNRRRLLDAATELFHERGLEVGVGEIAERAGVGRGTLFRNFPTKEDLIAAVVVDRMGDVIEKANELRDAPEPGDAVFALLEYMAGEQQVNRSLSDAIAEVWLSNDEIRASHTKLIAVIDELLQRAQAAGTIRDDVGALDVMMLLKGACEAANALGHGDPEVIQRHLDLARAALAPPATPVALRGRRPTLEDVERGLPQPTAS